MIKALFFDIDGTLVSFHTHVIPQSTIEAIAAARAKGLKIFIATGRPNAIINNLEGLQAPNLIDGYITMNGAYCFVGDEVIYKSPIPAADVHALAHLTAQRDISCIFVGEHDICVNRPDEEVQQVFVEFLKVDPIPVRDPAHITAREIYQMTPFISIDQQRELMPLMPGSEAGRWHPAFVDITARGNTKQHGIDEMIRHFGLTIDQVMAFGDGGNDAGMLRHAHIGVAMGNANEEVKQCADYVTHTVDDDGIAHALRHFNLI
jgi:Cof subfamily protein (haloacid dehalogenase superfamily)